MACVDVSSFASIQPNPNATQDRYQCVEDILHAKDYYRVLGVTKDASQDVIRRAYIRRSRVCHPDKFVPAYSRATESFQLLSMAYETLSSPSLKLVYDLSLQKKTDTAPSFVSTDQANGTIQRVLRQLFVEMMDGEFQTMHAVIQSLNDANPSVHIGQDGIVHIENAFLKMRELLLSTHQYYRVIQFELMQLYELQQEMRSLSYFNVWRRMQLSMTICKTLLQLPIIINTKSREKNKDDSDADGFLGSRVENALRMAVTLLETSERYTRWT